MTGTGTTSTQVQAITAELPGFSSGLDLDMRFAKIPTLSSREIEVFHLLADGASNRSISSQLHVTERTVKAHVGRILSKLDVESRTQAGIVAFAWRVLAAIEGTRRSP